MIRKWRQCINSKSILSLSRSAKKYYIFSQTWMPNHTWEIIFYLDQKRAAHSVIKCQVQRTKPNWTEFQQSQNPSISLVLLVNLLNWISAEQKPINFPYITTQPKISHFPSNQAVPMKVWNWDLLVSRSWSLIKVK